MEQFLAWVAGNLGLAVAAFVSISGTAAVVAIALVRKFGEKWLESKFDRQLSEYKHNQLVELERFKYRITALFDRTTKLHEREFEILPEAWRKLSEAFIHTRAAVTRFQQFPDFVNMEDEKFALFLTDLEMTDIQKIEFKNAPRDQRNSYFSKYLSWKQLDIARGKLSDYQLFIRTNSIFIERDIIKIFTEFCNKLNKSLVDVEASFSDKTSASLLDAWKNVGEEADKLMNDLELMVHKRLWNKEID